MNEGGKKHERKEFETPAEYYKAVFNLAKEIAKKNKGVKKDFADNDPIRVVDIKLEESPNRPGYSVFWFFTYNLNLANPDNPEGGLDANPFSFAFSEDRFSMTYREVLLPRGAKFFIDIDEYEKIEDLRAALVPFVEKLNLLLELSGMKDRLVLP